jgi:hypothetical protein
VTLQAQSKPVAEATEFLSFASASRAGSLGEREGYLEASL